MSEMEKSPEQLEQELNRIRYARALSRRKFIQRAGIATAAVAGSGMIAGCLGSRSMAQAAAISQADVLNFALNLEYLEAEFYLIAVNGTRLASTDTGSGAAPTTGGKQVVFTDANLQAIAQEIAADELTHVKFLRSALGAAAVSKPAINLDALGIGYNSEAEFLTLSRAFEDTGVSAYAGAATLLSGDNLQAAAQILATEAYHAGNIRLKSVLHGVTEPPTDAKDQPPTPTNFFPTDANGLALKRTTSEVLAIVYAKSTPGTSSGGFFPSGFNGNIKTI